MEYSDEGLWFEEFADAYDSKLAAAIEYLQAMKEIELSGNCRLQIDSYLEIYYYSFIAILCKLSFKLLF
ncbi:salt stress protein, Slr1339 family [Hyella patelloides]|uniref:salt stress protein, Slr1339 family n=1 Tax=Hyella patelloides TaxID=1982969 RepID=UPI003CCC8643